MGAREGGKRGARSEEHTSELQSRQYLVCRLLLEKKNKHKNRNRRTRVVARHVDGSPQPRASRLVAIVTVAGALPRLALSSFFFFFFFFKTTPPPPTPPPPPPPPLFLP